MPHQIAPSCTVLCHALHTEPSNLQVMAIIYQPEEQILYRVRFVADTEDAAIEPEMEIEYATLTLQQMLTYLMWRLLNSSVKGQNQKKLVWLCGGVLLIHYIKDHWQVTCIKCLRHAWWCS